MKGLADNKRCIGKKNGFLYSDRIGFAYLLDPCYLSDEISVEEKG
jgi:hypothetical protein